MKFILTVLISAMLTTSLFGQVISKEYKIKKGQIYLNLPVSNSANMVRARIKSNGKTLDRFTIKLAEMNPDFWTFFDVSEFQGKSVTVEVEAYTPPPGFAQTVSNTNVPVTEQLLNLVTPVATFLRYTLQQSVAGSMIRMD
jgi:hypothetical protein